MEKLSARIDALHVEMAQHDPTDIPGLTAMTNEVAQLEKQVSDHEHRWIELSELIDA
jgi:ATP-binding cassette subfamily F protein uup